VSVPVIFSTGSLYPFGLDRIYGWAAASGYDGVEIMMNDCWDTHQEAYLNYLTDKHGIPILTLHSPLREGVWRLDPGETLIRAARLAARIGGEKEVVVPAHPPPPGRPLQRWSQGPLKEARGAGVPVAVENMPKGSTRIFNVGRTSCYLPEHLAGIGEVTLDTSHVGASGINLMRTFEKLEDQLRHVHLSDSNLTGRDEHRLPGRGNLPLEEFLVDLGDSDFPGNVSLELKPWPLGTPHPEDIMKRMREALEYAREGLGAKRG
jgi:sugar phosphate isomerase/epimerase